MACHCDSVPGIVQPKPGGQAVRVAVKEEEICNVVQKPRIQRHDVSRVDPFAEAPSTIASAPVAR